MVNPSMQARLAEANARYHKAGEGPDGPPPGQYQMQLRSAVFREGGSGKYMIRWTFVVLDGAEQGQEVSDISALESENPTPLRILKERIRKLGIEPPIDVWDYQELCPQITRNAPLILGTVRHSGNYANVDILEVLQAVGNAAAASAPAPTPTMAVPPPTPVAISAPTPTHAPAVIAGAAVGDTVQYVDPATSDVIRGVVDEIDPTGQATVGISETEAILVPATALIVVARATVAPPTAPVPPVPMGVLPPQGLTPLPAPTPTPTSAPAPAPVEEPLRDKLIEIAVAFGLQVNDLMPQSDIVSTLAENEWFLGGEAGLNAAEAAVLTSVGIAVTQAAPAPAPAPTPAPVPKPKAAKRTTRKPKAKAAKKGTVARKKRG